MASPRGGSTGTRSSRTSARSMANDAAVTSRRESTAEEWCKARSKSREISAVGTSDVYGVLMKAALLHDDNGLRTYSVVLATGDEAMKALASFAVEHRVNASHFVAIGAFARVVVAYFDWASKRYQNISIDEQVEVLSFVGDITIENDEPKVHAHV